MKEPEKTERNLEIVRQVELGTFYKDIAVAFGISPERARQIFWRYRKKEPTPLEGGSS